MAKKLKTYPQSGQRARRTLAGGLAAFFVFFGLLGPAPALLAQAADPGEDFISDIFMEASEPLGPATVPPPPEAGPSPAPPAAAPAGEERPLPMPGPPLTEPAPPAAVSAPAPAPQALESAPVPAAPDLNRRAGKPVPHLLPARTALQAPKKAGKPPIQTAGADSALPTAVLEPEARAEATPAPASQPAPDGERPLPVPASGDGLGEDDFLSPEELAGSESNSLTMPINLGALPTLQWESTDPNAPAANFISNSPLPQFDSTDSNWKQLDIGQADVVTPPPPPERPGSVSTVTDPEAAPPPGGQGPDREHLRSLFNDMLPPPGQGARPAGGAAPPTRPDQPPPKTATGSQTFEPSLDDDPKKDVTAPALPENPAPAAGAESPDQYTGSSAILRAGGQLTVAGHFGEAAILPPLENAPDLAAWMATQKESPQAGEKEAVQVQEKTPAQKTQAPARNAPGAAQAKLGATAPVAHSPLSLVNETGNDSLVNVYRSVLSQMGYSIASVETRPPAAAPSGQTIITYRPGARARARGVAAHLPGRKTLVEAPGALPTEIVILLR